MRPETAEWLDVARRDLDAARVLLVHGQSDTLAIVGFLCQQAAEKGLKAWLVDPACRHGPGGS